LWPDFSIVPIKAVGKGGGHKALHPRCDGLVCFSKIINRIKTLDKDFKMVYNINS
jgi:hypothetical protein